MSTLVTAVGAGVQTSVVLAHPCTQAPRAVDAWADRHCIVYLKPSCLLRHIVSCNSYHLYQTSPIHLYHHSRNTAPECLFVTRFSFFVYSIS